MKYSFHHLYLCVKGFYLINGFEGGFLKCVKAFLLSADVEIDPSCLKLRSFKFSLDLLLQYIKELSFPTSVYQKLNGVNRSKA